LSPEVGRKLWHTAKHSVVFFFKFSGVPDIELPSLLPCCSGLWSGLRRAAPYPTREVGRVWVVSPGPRVRGVRSTGLVRFDFSENVDDGLTRGGDVQRFWLLCLLGLGGLGGLGLGGSIFFGLWSRLVLESWFGGAATHCEKL